MGKQETSLHYVCSFMMLLFSFSHHINIGLSSVTAQSSSSSACYEEGAACVPVTELGAFPQKCLSTTLTFSHTALMWVKDARSIPEVATELKFWQRLIKVPACWAVVQPFLCSVYLPKCDANTSRVEYPSAEACERTREPCKIVEELSKEWPSFLQCTESYFKRNCGTTTYDQQIFNITPQCESPLIKTETRASWWEGLEGCGLQCQNPLFTESEHAQVHVFVAVMGALCLTSTLFTVLTFLIDWQNASRYPALILFFTNVCFFVSSAGWLAQFTSSARRDIVCRSDGTARRAEPQVGSGETAACTVVFVLIYYFTMAGLCWFVMLCFAWHVTFRALGTPRDDLASKTAYFHLVSWSLPLVLTIVCLAISQIDGDSLSGVCFVGYENNTARVGFVLVPVGGVVICALFFLLKGLATLNKIRLDVPSYVGERAISKIRETIVRLGIFSVLSLAFGIITFSIHVYIFASEEKWRKSFKEYMYCLLNIDYPNRNELKSCTMQNRPSVVAMEIHIFAFFGAGIIMSSWTWTKATLSAWERFLRRVFHKPSNKPVQLRRHKLIAQAFEHRRDLTNGPVSISYHSTHDDPLGMKMDLHSVSSNVSNMSNFANNLPRLVRRRGGLVYPIAGTLRRYSDSDIASVVSRRLSQNSQQLDMSDAQYAFVDRENSSNNGGSTVGWHKRRRRRRKRRKKRNAVQPILGPVLSGIGLGLGKGGMRGFRRGSDTSVMSKASAQAIQMHLDQQGMGLGVDGSLSSLPGNEHAPGAALRARARSRRKLSRLEPLKRSVSSRSLQSLQSARLAQFYHPPLPNMYPGYDYDYSHLQHYPYAYPAHQQLAYPYWQHQVYPYLQAQFAHPPPTTDFSMFAASNAVPGATSSPEVDRRRILTASTSRRSEVTVETQQTEIIPMQKLKSGEKFKKPAPLDDESVEDLNSSELEDSSAETEKV